MNEIRTDLCMPHVAPCNPDPAAATPRQQLGPISAASPSYCAKRTRNGFSLIELLVTLAIVSMVVALGLPYLKVGMGNGALFASDVRVRTARLRLARELALASRTNSSVTLVFVVPGLRGPDTERLYEFKAVKQVSLRTARGVFNGENVDIVFGPDGSSTGGDITLEGSSETRVVHIDWLTGAVSTRAGGT